MSKIITSKVIIFFICGLLSAFINLVTIESLFEIFHPTHFFIKILINFIAIEISLLASFFLYRSWVWPLKTWSFPDLLLRQLPLYHVSCISSILLRVFLVFPVIDAIGINYKINTFIGICVSFWINYISGETLIFRKKYSNKLDLILRENFENLSPIKFKSDSYSKDIINTDPVSLFSIIIPAYNEEDCIQDTVYKIYRRLSSEQITFEILVVNDNSKDSTLEILDSLSQELSNFKYITNYYPNGFGFAVRCGLENFSGDAVTIVMADSSDSPDDIVRYYRALNEGYDCVFGSRFSSGGQVFDYPIHKLLVNRLANLFIQVVISVPHDDITNAFKAYRRQVIQGVSPLISHHFNLTVEIPLKAIIRGYSYATIPITWHNRQTGISKLKIREMGSRYLFIVLSLLLEKLLSRGDYIHNHIKLPVTRK